MKPDNGKPTRYEDLLLRLHRLIREGRGDSEAADDLRDAMDEAYRELDDAQDARLRGLSADLYRPTKCLVPPRRPRTHQGIPASP